MRDNPQDPFNAGTAVYGQTTLTAQQACGPAFTMRSCRSDGHVVCTVQHVHVKLSVMLPMS